LVPPKGGVFAGKFGGRRGGALVPRVKSKPVVPEPR